MRLMQPPQRPARGYLLMECMIAGAILAIALGTVIGQLAEARVEISHAADRDVAVGLANAKLSSLEADSSRTAVTQAATTTGLGAYPGYSWSWSLQNADSVETATSCNGTALSTDLHEFIVTVYFPARQGSSADMEDGLSDGQGSVTFRRITR